MPSNLTSLIEHVTRILGPDAHHLSPEQAVHELRHQSQHMLALDLEREIHMRGIASPVPYDAARDVYLPTSRPMLSGVDYGTNFEASAIYRARERVTAPTRPPAKAPTSTTTIGEAQPIDAAYAALVAELGVNSAAVDLERFKALVPELGLHVYDRAEVTEYLHCQYKVPPGDLTSHVVWGWRPLRAIDQAPGALHQFNGRIQKAAPLYAKPIPYPVLLTVKAVVDACPSARCYVSDEMGELKIPDPFLLVAIAGEQFVIERWDEPAFRATP
jgi:hypothetical protein